MLLIVIQTNGTKIIGYSNNQKALFILCVISCFLDREIKLAQLSSNILNSLNCSFQQLLFRIGTLATGDNESCCALGSSQSVNC